MTDNDNERFQHPEDVLRFDTAMLVRMDDALARQEVCHRP
jgi:hypothetical protein